MLKIKQDGEFILIEYLLNILVDGQEQMPVTEPLVTEINKIIQGKSPCNKEPLTDDDYKLLDKLCYSNGFDVYSLKNGLYTEYQFKQFNRIFEASEDKPDWVMEPIYTDYVLEAKKRRADLLEKHINLLERAAIDGMIKIFSMQHIPLTKIENGSIISREHAEIYFRGLGLTLQDMPHYSTIDIGNHDHEKAKGETSHIRTGTGYEKRDLDAALWLSETQPDIEGMTNEQIELALKARNPALWSRGFKDWKRKQTLLPKKKPGRISKKAG